jgi:uncharacterized protein
MKCPNCKEVNLTMSERQGVEIDYCPECRGVWLDRGELDKIIEKSYQESQKPSTNDAYRKDDRYEHKKYEGDQYKHKKRGGWLGDLFD